MAQKINERKLLAAFKGLRNAGYFAKRNFMCCQSCAWHAIGDEKETPRAVFYHEQDNDRLLEGGELNLAWRGDGHEIVGIIRAAGLKCEWTGTEDKRIVVQP